MEQLPKIISDDIEEDITIMDDMDLNNLFNLTYNFDILKSTISILFKNQENLLKKINKAYEINKQQNEYMESLHQESISQKDNLESKIKEIDQKITQIDEELVKSN